jgi:6-phosphofructokinase 1
MIKRLAIIVGGGPAPGINNVISSVTIEAINEGLEVIGILEGFKWISKFEISHIKHLTIDEVSRIHYQGGSIIGTSRDAPIDTQEKVENIVEALKALKIDYLVTIGGEGTAYIAYKLSEILKDSIKIAHVPKTIDNDLELPENHPTFGFETARQVGTDLVRNIMEDSRSTGRWYIVVTMGRLAGHLALGIAKASGATLAIIPEELELFDKPNIQLLIDMLEGAIIKRLSQGKDYGVAVIAEGVASKIDITDFQFPQYYERDESGKVRLSEVPIGKLIKDALMRSLKSRGIEKRIVDLEIGYVLRSAPPVAFDLEYTRNLGYGAIKFLLAGETGAIIAFKGANLCPVYFKDVLNKDKTSMKVRKVNLASESYKVAQNYMIRLEKSDFEEKSKLILLSKAANMSIEEFVERFKKVAIF